MLSSLMSEMVLTEMLWDVSGLDSQLPATPHPWQEMGNGSLSPLWEAGIEFLLPLWSDLAPAFGGTWGVN